MAAGTSGAGITAVFPPYPLKENLERDGDYQSYQAADYIAQTRGTRTIRGGDGHSDEGRGPNHQPADLVLAKPSQVSDTSWIKPGKVAWDWWNANNIYGVDFQSSVNTRTYKYYIDFAS